MYPCESVHPYEAEAHEKWGNTSAYQEFEKKTKGMSEEEKSNSWAQMMELFVEFGQMSEMDAACEEVSKAKIFTPTVPLPR